MQIYLDGIPHYTGIAQSKWRRNVIPIWTLFIPDLQEWVNQVRRNCVLMMCIKIQRFYSSTSLKMSRRSNSIFLPRRLLLSEPFRRSGPDLLSRFRSEPEVRLLSKPVRVPPLSWPLSWYSIIPNGPFTLSILLKFSDWIIGQHWIAGSSVVGSCYLIPTVVFNQEFFIWKLIDRLFVHDPDRVARRGAWSPRVCRICACRGPVPAKS